MELDLRKKFTDRAAPDIAQGEDPSPAIRQKIDPRFPITSLASGQNQFTTIADTHHGKGSIVDIVTREIPSIARAGVKHLMLERLVYLEGHPNRSKLDVEYEDLLNRINARPPQITAADILSQRHNFVSAYDKSKAKETGLAHANLLIAAMQNGITVHFVNDDRGYGESIALDVAFEEQSKYFKKNAQLERITKQFEKDPDYIQKLNRPEKEKAALGERIANHQISKAVYQKMIDNNLATYNEARCGLSSELTRAERFVNLANGEKTLLIFGADHFNKEMDLNEAIDHFLKQQALQKGERNLPSTPVAEIWTDKQDWQAYPAAGPDSARRQQPSLRIYADTKNIEIPESSAYMIKEQVSPAPARQIPVPSFAP